MPRKEAEESARRVRETYGPDTTDKSPKYVLGEHVEVGGWVKSDTGIVNDIKRVFHNRLSEWVWGYRIAYDNEGAGLTLLYVPEGYLRKLPEPQKAA